ncbi:sugar phosphate isomerase/epimerase family protein [Gracilibacillus alcaliphilus]|uniref:sugar phosphate isomerase/epimerase family protein n=1 Tax=Gracilibacillus alcaliphilus TaxID=1401441 RepID=UPI00195ADDC4|nr:sugar phosphate isomerase/epimerase [Gracilibacillus alcaliphilus]MBM7678507.1 sugar phosphate isomerase/epimerase [Gracilibacillus alcaliphilus]
MITKPIALQLFSVREALSKDMKQTLKEASEMGYEYVEFFFHEIYEDGTFSEEIPATELRAYMDSLGLRVTTIHVNYHPNLDVENVIRFNKELGSSGIVLPAYFFSSKEDAYELAEYCNKMAKIYKEHDLDFYYHNHFHEFEDLGGGETPMDILLANTDPELVKIELDAYWAVRAGLDPIAYMDKLGDRLGIVHMKDMQAKANPVNLLELFDGPITPDVAFSKLDMTEITEIGNGVLDIKAIVEKAEAIPSVQYIIVEQDFSAKGELISVKESLDNLNKLFS